MDFEHGILLFFIGNIATFVGFFIAFYVMNKVKEQEENDRRAREKKKIFNDDW